MSVLIKGMKMPENCGECDVICKNFQHGWDIPPEYEYKRHPDCPLVEVKTQHGRLIDAYALESAFNDALYECDDVTDAFDYAIGNAPTVIEAEE